MPKTTLNWKRHGASSQQQPYGIPSLVNIPAQTGTGSKFRITQLCSVCTACKTILRTRVHGVHTRTRYVCMSEDTVTDNNTSPEYHTSRKCIKSVCPCCCGSWITPSCVPSARQRSLDKQKINRPCCMCLLRFSRLRYLRCLDSGIFTLTKKGSIGFDSTLAKGGAPKTQTKLACQI